MTGSKALPVIHFVEHTHKGLNFTFFVEVIILKT